MVSAPFGNIDLKPAYDYLGILDVSKLYMLETAKYHLNLLMISYQLKLVTTFQLKQSLIPMVLEAVVVINPLALFQNLELVNDPFNIKVHKFGRPCP